ncbi:MAG TPA: autotransporter-associated beta strand repeat-containing protein, partial [Rhizomicrobium sp.]|nr:autotransporter-associated beta strand repeat-containing protein [Rhizomicrobium sp.]
MTTAFWNGTSDDWSNAADWSPGLPNPKRDAIVNADGTYTVTISSADKAQSLTIDNAGATLSENSGGSLTLGSGLTIDSGAAILDGANSFHGNTRLIGGTLELGNALALGNSNLTIDGGILIGIADAAMSNAMTASGTFTLAAAHGDTFRLASQTVLNMNGGGTIEFGQTGDDGVLVWDPATLGVADGGSGFAVDINTGTLRDGNGSLNEVLSAASTVNIAAGATLGIGGYADTINELFGSGNIASNAGSALTVENGDFSGDISGGIALTVIHQLQLSGTNTYTGSTTIAAGAQLTLTGTGLVKGGVTVGSDATFDIAGSVSVKGAVIVADGAALNIAGNGSVAGGVISGSDAALDVADNGSITNGVTIGDGSTLSLHANSSISGNIADNGTFLIERSGSSTLTLNNTISGTGALDITSGKVILGTLNSYSGSTTLDGGTLKIDNIDELGTGPLVISHGTLVTTATISFDDSVTFEGGGNFSAASGTMLTIDTASWALGSNAKLSFGTSSNDGVVVWDSPASAISGSVHSLSIKGGTLRAGNSDFQTLLNGITSMESTATLDIAGFSEDV